MRHARFSKQTIGLMLICGAFLLQWLVLFYPKAPTWDGAFYYSYARSLIFDGDLHLVNDIVLAYPTGGDHFAGKLYETDLTATGHLNNVFAPGSALFWMPWLAITRSAELILGTPLTTTGYELPVVSGAAFISALLVLIAFILLYHKLATVFDWSSAALAVLTLMFATPLLNYQFRNGFYSHAASAFVTTLCVLWWWRSYDKPMRSRAAFIFGLLLGLSILVRWQHAIYFALPLLSVVWWWWRRPASEKRAALRPAITSFLLTGGGALLVASIQIYLWHLYYGTWLTVPQGDTFMDFRALWLLPTLFSPYRGLLAWMPVVVPSIIGLLLLAKRQSRLAVPLLFVLTLAIYVNASTRDWFAGGGYGPRRFTSELSILVIGYAALMATIAPRLRWWIGGALWIVFATHQWILLNFGVTENLGGTLLNMAPTFNWREQSWGEFAQALLAHVPDLPSIIVMNESPLWKWRQNVPTLPTELLVWLIIALLVTLCCVVVVRLWRVSDDAKS